MTAVGPRARDAHIWARHPDDFYCEPQWLDKRIFEEIQFVGEIVDPCCGLGRIPEAAISAGYKARGYDKVQRSFWCQQERDFLADVWTGELVDNIVCNPPYALAQAIISEALLRSADKVVMILPARFCWGDERSRWLESTHPRQILAVTPRPSMPPGPVIEAGIKPGGGKEDFSVFVWECGFAGKPEAGWLRRDCTK